MTNPFLGQGITIDDKPSDKVEYIIDGFLAKGAITTYYAPAKHGKSVVAQALSKYICENTSMRVQYFDFDNGLVSLVERGWFEVADALKDSMDYISKDKVQREGYEVVESLLKYTRDSPKDCLSNFVLIWDSAVNFMQLDNDDNAKKLLRALMWFRSKGATNLLLHHMNKSGRSYQGSQVFVTASDNIYEHTMVDTNAERSIFTHKKRNTRFSDMRDIAFEIQKTTFNMKILDYKEAFIPPSEQEFIEKVIKVLKNFPNGITQGKLLEKSVGKKSSDKTSRDLLGRYTGRFWNMEEKPNGNFFTLP